MYGFTEDSGGAVDDRFAIDWIASWNARDLPRILAHYDDSIVYVSPLVARRFGRPDGAIRAKPELALYFRIGLDAYRDLKFELVSCLYGTDAITVLYRGVRKLLVAEHMVLGSSGRIASSHVHYSRQSFGGAVFATCAEDEVIWI